MAACPFPFSSFSKFSCSSSGYERRGYQEERRREKDVRWSTARKTRSGESPLLIPRPIMSRRRVVLLLRDVSRCACHPRRVCGRLVASFRLFQSFESRSFHPPRIGFARFFILIILMHDIISCECRELVHIDLRIIIRSRNVELYIGYELAEMMFNNWILEQSSRNITLQ